MLVDVLTPGRTCALSWLVGGNIWDVIPHWRSPSFLMVETTRYRKCQAFFDCTVASSVLYAVQTFWPLHGMSSSHSEPSKETASWSQISDDFRWTNTSKWRSSSWAEGPNSKRQRQIRIDGWVPSLDDFFLCCIVTQCSAREIVLKVFLYVTLWLCQNSYWI